MLPNPLEEIARRLDEYNKRLSHLERLESPSGELSIPLFAWASPPAFGTTQVDIRNVLSWNFTNGTTEVIDTTIPYFAGMNAGTLALRTHLEPSSANALNAFLTVDLRIVRTGSLINLAPDVRDAIAVAMPGVANQVLAQDFDLSGLTLQENDRLALRFFRSGGDALDTFTGDLYLRGTSLIA